jgi:phosphoribosylamine--glycine ligase
VKFLVIDPYGLALDIAYRAECAGHEVKMWVRDDPKSHHIGLGLVDVIRDYTPWLRWADLIFMSDNTKHGVQLDSFRTVSTTPIVGPTREMAKWETDRAVGQAVLKKHGIATIPTHEFNNYDKAIAFIKKHPNRYVSKPSNEDDKALSYCAQTPADMVYMLERWKKTGKQLEFILQEFIPGIEMGVGAWFGPRGWVGGWEENFEFKKLMDGDKGVATGEQGTVLRYTVRSKLARMMLEPLTETLEKEGYLGDIDVNCIIDEKGNPWPLEFTMRPGWPTFNIQQELHEGDPAEWLWELAKGKDPTTLKNLIAIGVVLSVPDYPYSHLTRKEVVGSPIYGLTPRLMRHTHFCEVMQGEAPVDRDGKVVNESIPVTAGDYVLVMSATGQTVYDAKQTVYRRLKALTLPNSPMWRTDIGDRLSKQLPKLQRHGFATGLEFSTAPPP